ncbi:MAG: hypothetical protein ACRDXX_07085 [Stackebrandtia sp.]
MTHPKSHAIDPPVSEATAWHWAAPSFNPGPSAEMYGSLAAVLAGFAFAGLVLYLERQRKWSTRDDQATPEPAETGQRRPYAHIKPAAIATTLFYAMSALTICAFLYGRLAGESKASGRTFLVLALYGVVLALAVLSLFYALNLVMVTHEGTRNTALATRWVVAAVGPAVVVGLLADLLANAWAYGCRDACSGWMSPRLWGFVLAMAFLTFGLLTTSQTARRLRPFSRPVRWLLAQPRIQAAADVFRDRPHYPAFITLFLASAIGVISLWARGISDGVDPRYWTHAVLVFAALAMATFAFAAGSVLDEPIARPHRLEAAPNEADPD